MSLVVPAYNEQERISIMLTEAVAYLQQAYGKASPTSEVNGVVHRQNGIKSSAHGNASSNLQDEAAKPSDPTGWEILIVSDGSTDKTAETALEFARDLGSELSQSVRVVSLRVNKGKGGAVTHGMRHVRGQYAIFADADGASRFEDLGKLLTASKKVEDAQGRSVAVGSRAHLVGSEAVVKVYDPPCKVLISYLRKPILVRALTSFRPSSDPLSASSSCTPSTFFYASSRRRPRRPFATRSAASSSSRARRCRTSSRTCIAKVGSSTSRC